MDSLVNNKESKTNANEVAKHINEYGKSIMYSNKSRVFQPKLIINDKSTKQYGSMYINALREALFTHFEKPYRAPEVPLSVFQEGDNVHKYICRQCKDCFHHSSSLDEHTFRGSWILGYWCTHCFQECEHLAGKKLYCSKCIKLQIQKYKALQSRGLRKGDDPGIVKIFFNPCQLLEHMQMHNSEDIFIHQLMLLPFPSGIGKEYFPHLKMISEALMDFMFLTNVHIIDWLLQNKIHKWWRMAKGDNPVANIIKRYPFDVQQIKQLLNCNNKVNQINKSNENSNGISLYEIQESNTSESENQLNKNTSCSSLSLSNVMTSNKSSVSLNTNLQSTADITFVDCGPCNDEHGHSIDNGVVTTLNTTKESSTLINTCTLENLRNKSSTTLPPKAKISVKKFAKVPSSPLKNTMTAKTNSVTVPVSKKNARSSPRVVTIRSAKPVNLSSLIKNFPQIAQKVANKKIVFIRKNLSKDMDLMNIRNFQNNKVQSVSLLNSGKEQNIKGHKIIRVRKLQQHNLLSGKLENSNLGSKSDQVQSLSQRSILDYSKIKTKMIKKPTFNAHNLKVYPSMKSKNICKTDAISRITSNIEITSLTSQKQIVPTNSESIENHINIVNLNRTANDKVIQMNENFDSFLGALKKTSKQILEQFFQENELMFLTVTKNEKSGKSFLSVAREKSGTCINDKLTYRNKMFTYLSKMNRSKVYQRVSHIKVMSRKYSEKVGVSNDEIIEGHKIFISILEDIAVHLDSSSQCVDDYFGPLLDPISGEVCTICYKISKPSEYLVGFSNVVADLDYCLCYDFICYKCNTFQGNKDRFNAHLRYHNSESPYICPECNISFLSFQSLNVHVWTECFHPLIRRFLSCSICEINGFCSLESIVNHFVIMHSFKMAACNFCCMVFEYKRYCVSHMKKGHPESTNSDEPLQLTICQLDDKIIPIECYNYHMKNHKCVQESIFYKCNLCSDNMQLFKTQELIKKHIYKCHYSELSTFIDTESLKEILLMNNIKEIIEEKLSKGESDVNTKDKRVIEIVQFTETVLAVAKDLKKPSSLSSSTLLTEDLVVGSNDHSEDSSNFSKKKESKQINKDTTNQSDLAKGLTSINSNDDCNISAVSLESDNHSQKNLDKLEIHSNISATNESLKKNESLNETNKETYVSTNFNISTLTRNQERSNDLSRINENTSKNEFCNKTHDLNLLKVQIISEESNVHHNHAVLNNLPQSNIEQFTIESNDECNNTKQRNEEYLISCTCTNDFISEVETKKCGQENYKTVPIDIHNKCVNFDSTKSLEISEETSEIVIPEQINECISVRIENSRMEMEKNVSFLTTLVTDPCSRLQVAALQVSNKCNNFMINKLPTQNVTKSKSTEHQFSRYKSNQSQVIFLENHNKDLFEDKNNPNFSSNVSMLKNTSMQQEKNVILMRTISNINSDNSNVVDGPKDDIKFNKIVSTGTKNDYISSTVKEGELERSIEERNEFSVENIPININEVMTLMKSGKHDQKDVREKYVMSPSVNEENIALKVFALAPSTTKLNSTNLELELSEISHDLIKEKEKCFNLLFAKQDDKTTKNVELSTDIDTGETAKDISNVANENVDHFEKNINLLKISELQNNTNKESVDTNVNDRSKQIDINEQCTVLFKEQDDLVTWNSQWKEDSENTKQDPELDFFLDICENSKTSPNLISTETVDSILANSQTHNDRNTKTQLQPVNLKTAEFESKSNTTKNIVQPLFTINKKLENTEIHEQFFITVNDIKHNDESAPPILQRTIDTSCYHKNAEIPTIEENTVSGSNSNTNIEATAENHISGNKERSEPVSTEVNYTSETTRSVEEQVKMVCTLDDEKIIEQQVKYQAINLHCSLGNKNNVQQNYDICLQPVAVKVVNKLDNKTIENQSIVKTTPALDHKINVEYEADAENRIKGNGKTIQQGVKSIATIDTGINIPYTKIKEDYITINKKDKNQPIFELFVESENHCNVEFEKEKENTVVDDETYIQESLLKTTNKLDHDRSTEHHIIQDHLLLCDKKNSQQQIFEAISGSHKDLSTECKNIEENNLSINTKIINQSKMKVKDILYNEIYIKQPSLEGTDMVDKNRNTEQESIKDSGTLINEIRTKYPSEVNANLRGKQRAEKIMIKTHVASHNEKIIEQLKISVIDMRDNNIVKLTVDNSRISENYENSKEVTKSIGLLNNKLHNTRNTEQLIVTKVINESINSEIEEKFLEKIKESDNTVINNNDANDIFDDSASNNLTLALEKNTEILQVPNTVIANDNISNILCTVNDSIIMQKYFEINNKLGNIEDNKESVEDQTTTVENKIDQFVSIVEVEKSNHPISTDSNLITESDILDPNTEINKKYDIHIETLKVTAVQEGSNVTSINLIKDKDKNILQSSTCKIINKLENNMSKNLICSLEESIKTNIINNVSNSVQECSPLEKVHELYETSLKVVKTNEVDNDSDSINLLKTNEHSLQKANKFVSESDNANSNNLLLNRKEKQKISAIKATVKCNNFELKNLPLIDDEKITLSKTKASTESQTLKSIESHTMSNENVKQLRTRVINKLNNSSAQILKTKRKDNMKSTAELNIAQYRQESNIKKLKIVTKETDTAILQQKLLKTQKIKSLKIDINSKLKQKKREAKGDNLKEENIKSLETNSHNKSMNADVKDTSLIKRSLKKNRSYPSNDTSRDSLLLQMPTLRLIKTSTRSSPVNFSCLSENAASLQTVKKYKIGFYSNIDSLPKIYKFKCHLCGDAINTSWAVVSDHYNTKHAHNYELCTISPKLIRIPDKDVSTNKNINKKRKSSETPFANVKRRKRWSPKKVNEKLVIAAERSSGLFVQLESVIDGEGHFKCKKCDERCVDMVDLRQHISDNHRIAKKNLICLECGENFVVSPSLQMHLRAFHGIDDTIAYMNKYPAYAPDIIDLEAEAKTTVANQCHVCMAVFKDKPSVDKHLRVHGMAFLNKKRIEARNAQLTSTKKEKYNKDRPDSNSDREYRINREILDSKKNIPSSSSDKTNSSISSR